MTTALRLQEWREKRGLSLWALAERAGVSHLTIWRIEGRKLSPTVAMLETLAKGLDIEVVEFFLRPKSGRRPRPGGPRS